MSKRIDDALYFKELIRKLKELRISADSGDIVVPNDDEDVLGILKTIDKIAPVDSVLACSEPWGDFYHRECWNIRPPEWWSDTLANWEFEFYNDYILTDPPGRSKGFIATRL